MSAGLKGNWTRESNWRGWDLGPVMSAGALVQPAGGARWKWRYEAELSYDDDLSKLSSESTQQSTRVQTLELKYAKVSALKLAGADLKERLHFVPYLYTGVQSVRSRSDTDGEVAFDRYWSPTWGAGIEFSLSRKTRLSLDWEQNTEGGERRITRLYLELKFAFVGDPDDS